MVLHLLRIAVPCLVFLLFVGCAPGDPTRSETLSLHAAIADDATLIPMEERRAFVMWTVVDTTIDDGLAGAILTGQGVSSGDFVDLELNAPPPPEAFFAPGSAALGIVVVLDEGVDVPAGFIDLQSEGGLAISQSILGMSMEHFITYAEDGEALGLPSGYGCATQGESGFVPVSCGEVVIQENPFYGVLDDIRASR